MEKIGIIGCGNLGMSLLKGFRKQYPDTHLHGTRRHLAELVGQGDELTHFTSDNAAVIATCDYLILALKPYTILSFLIGIQIIIRPGKTHTD